MITIESREKKWEKDIPLVMGVLNCNEDSFFAGSRATQSNQIQSRVDQLVAEGADIIDVGGRSSRPGSQFITVDEEISRIRPAIEYIVESYPELICSIDTTQAEVANFALERGFHIVNDISSGEMDEQMLKTVSTWKVPYICMHMQGRPEFMQDNPTYVNVVQEVYAYLEKKIDECKQAGIEQIWIDPGFGFGKSIDHNYQLMKELEVFTELNAPLLVGISRKSMIYKFLQTSADEALNGTSVLNTIALMKGASILRVHDVRAAKEAVQLISKINEV